MPYRSRIEVHPEIIDGDLIQCLYAVWYTLTSDQRNHARWVMNEEWLKKIEKLPKPLNIGGVPARDGTMQKLLFLIPVDVQPDGGEPHLVSVLDHPWGYLTNSA